MFTGIITNKGNVTAINIVDKGKEIILKHDIKEELHIGQSIACDGACMTVTELVSADQMRFFVSYESLSKTNIDEWQLGSQVNLELAMQLGERLDGHLVSGHVDFVSKLVSKEQVGESYELTFSLDKSKNKYLIDKGSVTINGISFTVNYVAEDNFAIYVIPHTYNITNISKLNIESKVNIELDLVAKYIEKFVQK